MIIKGVDLKGKNVMTFGHNSFFRDLITLQTDFFLSCNLSECCLHSFKQSKTYNRAKTKTCHLPGSGPLLDLYTSTINRYHLVKSSTKTSEIRI